MKLTILLLLATLLVLVTVTPMAGWPPAKAPVIPQADGYVAIPGAAVTPHAGRMRAYRAIFDATRAPDRPTELLPALNMAGSELNALAVERIPAASTRFVVVFHGPAVDGLLEDQRYRATHGVANPNLPVLAAMKRAGVQLFVCGQHLAAARIDPAILTRDVTVASDALIVLMEYQSDGYALLSF